MVDVQEGIRKPGQMPWSAVARVLRDRRVRYLATGAVAAAVYYILFTIGWLAGGGAIPYLVCALLAHFFTAILTYQLYRRIVWQVPEQGLRGFLKFYAVGLWALTLTLVGLPILIEWVGLPVLLAQAIIVFVNPLVNYQLMRFWAFRHRGKRPVSTNVGDLGPEVANQ